MTGKEISTTVNRAFMVIGALFFFGGLYLGGLTYLQAPEVYKTEGRILSLRVEKRRPLGFENIPVDSTDPAHEGIPLYTDTFATVDYTWKGVSSRAEITVWSEAPGWTEGMTLPLYLVEGEEEYPLHYYPSEAAGEKKEALIIIIAMPLMGGVLALVGFFSGRREQRRDRKLLETVRTLARPRELRMTTGRTLYEGVNKGNFLMGGILTAIGSLLTAIMVFQLFHPGAAEQRWILPFPLLLGMGNPLFGTE